MLRFAKIRGPKMKKNTTYIYIASAGLLLKQHLHCMHSLMTVASGTSLFCSLRA